MAVKVVDSPAQKLDRPLIETSSVQHGVVNVTSLLYAVPIPLVAYART